MKWFFFGPKKSKVTDEVKKHFGGETVIETERIPLREGIPVEQAFIERSILKYINSEACLLSLLYDLDTLPEQLVRDTPEWTKMLQIALHFKGFRFKLTGSREDPILEINDIPQCNENKP